MRKSKTKIPYDAQNVIEIYESFEECEYFYQSLISRISNLEDNQKKLRWIQPIQKFRSKLAGEFSPNSNFDFIRFIRNQYVHLYNNEKDQENDYKKEYEKVVLRT